MAEIRPFRGLRYSVSAGNLDSLVAPPYDVLTSEERTSYADQSNFNVVHLTLPEQREDDRSKYIQYARSAALLSAWQRERILTPETEPALYRYSQTFAWPGFPGGVKRVSIIGLLRLEPFEKGVVLPHEQTFPKHKEDRLRILEATRAHLETIFGLYEDEDQSLLHLIESSPALPGVECDVDGIHHSLEPITDPEAVEALQEAFAERKLWIADGHHRYETALAFREALGERDGTVAEDYIPTAFASLNDPNLLLLPTHRVVKKLAIDEATVTQRLAEWFELESVPEADLVSRLDNSTKTHTFGVVLPNTGSYLLNPKSETQLEEAVGTAGSSALRGLDVSVLHSVILEKALGIKGTDQLTYTRNAQEAFDAVHNGAAASFLMNPPTVQDMQKIALGGERMPQKSTFYFPKILSGLVLWSLNDFGGV